MAIFELINPINPNTMKQKLLLLLLLLSFTLTAFSQATAYQPGFLIQCDNPVVDLTVNTPIVLGNQQQPQFTVGYFTTQADANANTNAIPDPSAYTIVATGQDIYVRVTNTQDNSYDTTSFVASAPSTQYVQQWSDFTHCGAVILPPPLPGMGYTLDEAGTVAAPLAITSTTQIYLQHNGYCWVPSSFMAIVLPEPVVPQIADVIACDSYVLPALSVGDYFTAPDGPNGAGTQIFPGDVITSSQTVYVYASNGTCDAQRSFTVTIESAGYLGVANVQACTEYVLPDLPAEYSYFSAPGGFGPIAAGTVITESTTLYQLHQTANCMTEQSFTVTIGNPVIAPQQPLTVCDPDGDGLAAFDLNSRTAAIVNGVLGLTVTYHETLSDAQTGTNPLISPYTNISVPPQPLFVRVEGIGGCYSTGLLELQAIACATISGIVRIDADNNGCSPSDGPATNIPVAATFGNTVQYAYTDSQGEYTFSELPQGNYILNTSPGFLGTSSPMEQPVSVSGNNSYTADFCITPSVPVNDLLVSLSAQVPPRPGFATSYYAIVYNMGNTVQSGTLSVAYDDARLNFTGASPVETSQVPGSLTFDYSNLQPFHTKVYTLSFMTEIPPIANVGDQIAFTLNSESPLPDATPENNQHTFTYFVVNSYDPNDISVAQGDFIYLQQLGDNLNYTIRFQNIGNADAVNVKIANTLDANLDWDSFRPVAASHGFHAQRQGDQVTFRFDGINLPGSTANEPASHGFVTYTVKPKQSMAVGDIIHNNADIYFDFNPPVPTNTVATQLLDLLGVEGHHFNNLKIYPNPASETVTVAIGETLANDVTVGLYDIRGKKILESVTSVSEFEFDVSGVQSGLYFLKIVSGDASVMKKLIVN